MELKDYIAILRRRHRIFVGVLIIGGVVFASMVGMEKVTHSASARIVVSSDLVDPLYGSAMELPYKPAFVTLATKHQVLTSKPVLEVAARLLLARAEGMTLRRADKDDVLTEADALLVKKGLVAQGDGIEGGARGSATLRALEQELAASVTTEPDPGSQYVTIHARAASGDRAVDHVNAMALGAQAYSFRKAQKDVQRALDNLVRHLERNRSALLELEEQMGPAGEAFLRIQDEYSGLGQQIRLEETRVVELDGTIQQRDEEIRMLLMDAHVSAEFAGDVGTNVPASEEVRDLRARRRDIETTLAGKMLTQSPPHPEIRRLQSELDEVSRNLSSARNQDVRQYLAQLRQEMDRARHTRENLSASLERHREERRELGVQAAEIQPFVHRREELARENEVLSEYRLKFESMQSIRSGFVDVIELSDMSDAMPKRVLQGGFFWVIMTLLVALGVCYLAEYMDTSLMNEYDVRRHLNLPILGIVPYEADQKILLPNLALRHPMAEIFNTAATLIRSAMTEAGLKSFAICSAVAKEGKTSISVDLAVAMARKGLRVILVDGDLRIPTVHSIFGMDNSRGLVTLLQAMTAPDGQPEDRALADYLCESGVEGLRVLPSGPSPQSATRLIESGEMLDVIRELEGQCDFLVIDTPPICTVGDTLMLSTMVDACVLVVGAAIAEQKDVTWAKHLMDNVSASILGVVLNRVTSGKGTEYYYYYSSDRKRVRRR